MPLVEATPTKLLTELQLARKESDKLFQILRPEALYERPIAQRHRVIFYIGHLDGFDAIQISREGAHKPSPDPELDALFQAGIDPDSANLPKDKQSEWPTLDEITSYVARCRQHVDEVLDQCSEDLLLMAIEHRQMHMETLAYMFHNFAFELKRPGEDTIDEPPSSGTETNNEWITIPAGTATLGMKDDGQFGWDNEFGQVRREVPSFRIQKHKITNGEYLRCVESGAPMPHFWTKRNGEILYRGMFAEIPLPLDWPVYVTEQEAEQYARWIGARLPTEEEFHRAAYGSFDGNERMYPWGEQEPSWSHGNFDFKRWDPEPVTATPDGDSAFGVSQMLGNGWEWTETIFAPFPGFHSRPSYPGYSANFFDGEHNVIKGGSPRTAARLLRKSFRNWFRRDYQYVYAGFRCVTDLNN
ncbi:MAG TPA: SUMF1/EgtB/PvdO family nonheme iron enzyme [Bryobacteraceae bacterium]|jgi:formylglycine-generating enzyme required for sulfatase activity|nr:SUMF1/EgtB/PvdO family nonheme iron enzyme [Bryobacteraceae bacterium]